MACGNIMTRKHVSYDVPAITPSMATYWLKPLFCHKLSKLHCFARIARMAIPAGLNVLIY